MTDLPDLSLREKEVLQQIIQHFIITANPVPSKNLAIAHNWNLSPATIRNVMQSLEKKGLIDQLHTSSGRIPTEKGYRYYVDSLMRTQKLSKKEQEALNAWEETMNRGLNDAIQSASILLSRLSNLLAIVIAPRYADSVFRKLELIDIGSDKLLVVLTIVSGLVKTVTIEVKNPITSADLRNVSAMLNERFSGLKIKEIAKNITSVLSDVELEDKSGIVRIFMDSAEDIFDDIQVRRFYFGGAEYMAMQPEFSDLKNYRSIVELIENEDLIIHLFDDETKQEPISDVKIRIGSENKIEQIASCSVVSANYTLGNAKGTIGLVGPTRMNYPKMVALVKQLAGRLNQKN